VLQLLTIGHYLLLIDPPTNNQLLMDCNSNSIKINVEGNGQLDCRIFYGEGRLPPVDVYIKLNKVCFIVRICSSLNILNSSIREFFSLIVVSLLPSRTRQ